MSSFFCQFCKQNKLSEHKRRIILEELQYDNMVFGVICANCFYKLKTLLLAFKISGEQKQQILDVWGVKIDPEK